MFSRTVTAVAARRVIVSTTTTTATRAATTRAAAVAAAGSHGHRHWSSSSSSLSTTALASARVSAANNNNNNINNIGRRFFADDSHDDFKPQVHTDSASDDAVNAIIDSDVKDNAVFLYMKGTPEAPQCGFSRHVCAILAHYQVPFKSRNVLENADIREGIKRYSDWPTIPQLYVDGEFIGGCDIVTQMHTENELSALFGQEPAAAN